MASDRSGVFTTTLAENKHISSTGWGTNGRASRRDIHTLSQLISAQRLKSYLHWGGGDHQQALTLYEWNMAAASAVLLTCGMVEVLVRTSMDQALQERASARGWSSWFDEAPLDHRGRADIHKARLRATGGGKDPENHGKVIAELTLDFWRYLAAPRYLTTLWIPALYYAFGNGPGDPACRRHEVEQHLRSLLLVRNRSAHHEPILRRNLQRDFQAAVELSSWVHPTAEQWVQELSTLRHLAEAKPVQMNR
ncbi:MAG: hypothetical protein ACRC0L_09205 [Angustibacter sp.]